jgi:hypothetical protein
MEVGVMDKSISDQLDAILDSHAKKVEDLAKAVTARKEIEQDFLRAYSDHRDRVIDPALKEAAEYIENRGMKTSIDRNSHGGSAAISLNLLIGDKTRSAVQTWPHVKFVANKDEKLVVVYENTIGPTGGGHSGDVGKVKLDQLTPTYIHQKVVALMRQVLA